MADSGNDGLLGRLAVRTKMLTQEQLAEVTAQQGRLQEPVSVGRTMVAMELISEEQLEALLKAQAEHLENQRTKATPAPSSAEQAVQSTPTPRDGIARPSGDPASVSNNDVVSKLRVTGVASSSLLDSVLRKAVTLGASDVHVHANTPILMRVHGHLTSVGELIEPSRADEVVRSLLVDDQQEVLDSEGQLDFAYEIAGVARFRCNAYRQQNGTDVILRIIPPAPPSLAQLGLPSLLGRLAHYHQGLVLVTGPSGCGKSSTLAALVNIANNERCDHILTIEDPIEYVHESVHCVVNQREVLRHTETFARALRAALREDPDIIAIGELRDLETISLAITASETGHLVFGTLHTNDTISTINRLIGVFQPDEQPQVLSMLSGSLKAVVSQRLVPRADGKGRVPALEILFNNRAVGSLIRADKAFQLRSVLQTGAAQGMMLLDDSLAQLVREGIVAREVAVGLAIEPSKFPA